MTSVTVIRRGLSPPTLRPSSLRLTPTSFGVSDGMEIRRGRLRVPEGWQVESPSPLAWFVTPDSSTLDFDTPSVLKLELEFVDGSIRTYSRPVTVQLDLETTFSLDPHAYPERNSASVIGEVDPDEETFRGTYRWLPGPLRDALFRGLYSDIVQLRKSGKHRGGLCSGMARWAGLRSVEKDESDPGDDEALREISTLHGRQLTDRALLSGFRWFLRGSPSAAYRAVREDFLATGQSLRALDVAVPKPWRRDLPGAIVREGHTVVPYRIRQPSPSRAFVDCYDPNRGREGHAIEFHLDTDRYAYRNKVSLDESNVGIIAVPHKVYALKGTAFLATIGSLLWLVFGPGRRASGEEAHNAP